MRTHATLRIELHGRGRGAQGALEVACPPEAGRARPDTGHVVGAR